MNPLLYLKIAIVVALVALTGYAIHLNQELGAAEQELKDATFALEVVGQAKAKAEKAQAELKEQLEQQQAATTETIIEVLHTPKSDDEACMSPVLKNALREALK